MTTIINNIEYDFDKVYIDKYGYKDNQYDTPLKSKASVIKRLTGQTEQTDELYYGWIDNFRDDKEIALLAIKNETYGLSLKYFSPRLQNDKEVVIAQLNKNDIEYVLMYVSEELRDNEEVADLAMSQNPKQYKYLSARLKCQLKYFNTLREVDEMLAFDYAPGIIITNKMIEEYLEKYGNISINLLDSTIFNNLNNGDRLKYAKQFLINNISRIGGYNFNEHKLLKFIDHNLRHDKEVVKAIVLDNYRELEDMKDEEITPELLLEIYDTAEDAEQYLYLYVPNQYRKGIKENGRVYLENLTLKNKLDSMLKLNEVETTTKRMKI